MRRGAWHQFGDRSQKLALEQLEAGAGVGVIVSVRDIKRDGAIQYAPEYKAQGADLLIDQQFYNPDFVNANLETYPIHAYRKAVSKMALLSDADLTSIGNELRTYHTETGASGLIAPAVMYEAGRPDIVELNRRLFTVSKLAAADLGIPVYASVILARSVTSSNQTLDTALSQATALDCDGWYFGFEFGNERIPSSTELVIRFGSASLALACTGKPVMHAFATPMALLSFGFGARAAAIGYAQNLWQFTRARFEPATKGGGADAPARFFSRNLWGTIVYPDETSRLTPTLRDSVLNQTPFSTPTATGQNWPRWDSNKHLVNVICGTVTEIADASDDPRVNANAAIDILDIAIDHHQQIAAAGVPLKDNSSAYQANWKTAVQTILADNSADYDLIDLLK
jgi:hypothetical protein